MEILGLPLHPLVVHAAVVLVPLGALGALLVVAVPRLRARYGWLTLVVALAGFASAFAARLSGPGFAEQLGLAGSPRIAAHQAYGMWAPWPVLVMVIALAILLATDSRRDRAGGSAPGPSAPGPSVLSGHAGATAVWGP